MTQNNTDRDEQQAPEPVLVDRNAVLDAVALFCANFDTLGERFKKQLRNAIRAVPRASIAAVAGDAQTIYADGYCARCSELAYPLTRALEKTGVPTGADNWQQTYGPNKVRALADLETCLRRLLNAIDEGKPEEIASRAQRAKNYIEFHAEVRRRLTALAQDTAAASTPCRASTADKNSEGDKKCVTP